MYMEKIELSERLKNVAEFVRADEIILDIGSDHAYLPIYLIQQQKIPAAIAGEVVAGPFTKAQQEIANAGLEQQIETRLGSGFDVIAPTEKMGTVFICGMGGLLISEILATGFQQQKINADTRLVLQPNNKEAELRRVLMDAQFEIKEEAMVKEKGKFYEIIVAEASPTKITYTDAELTFGPVLMQAQTPVFQEKWQAIYKNNQKIIAQLDAADHEEKRTTLIQLNQLIEKVVKWQLLQILFKKLKTLHRRI